TFYDGTFVLGTSSVSLGTATINTPFLSAGRRSLKAHYSGDGSFGSSDSAPYVEIVNAVVGGGFLPIRHLLSGQRFPSTVVIADFNNDGRLDIARGFADADVFLGNGDGTFISRPSQASAWGLFVGDVNGDGKTDLLSSDFNGNTVLVRLGN